MSYKNVIFLKFIFVIQCKYILEFSDTKDTLNLNKPIKYLDQKVDRFENVCFITYHNSESIYFLFPFCEGKQKILKQVRLSKSQMKS